MGIAGFVRARGRAKFLQLNAPLTNAYTGFIFGHAWEGFALPRG